MEQIHRSERDSMRRLYDHNLRKLKPYGEKPYDLHYDGVNTSPGK